MTTSDLAPTIPIHLTALNGSCSNAILPDFGADISAADTPLLTFLNDHIPLMSSLTLQIVIKCIPLDTYPSPSNSALGNAPAIYTSTQTSLAQFSH